MRLKCSFCSQVGQADLSFFSVDCFHISERAHAEMAIALWNNMVSEAIENKASHCVFMLS